MIDFTIPIDAGGGLFSIIPTVEFTEDDWNTVYEGSCKEKTHYAYLVRSNEYGTFWIPKENVRLKIK